MAYYNLDDIIGFAEELQMPDLESSTVEEITSWLESKGVDIKVSTVKCALVFIDSTYDVYDTNS